MKKSNFLLFFVITSFLSCSPLKRLKTVTQGKVEQENYIQEIPFKLVKNQIVIEVEINNKNYDFIFDTGNDLTTIDHNILKEISHKSNNVNGKISDSNKNITLNEYLSVSNIKIGKIDFKNIGAYSSDFTHFYQFLGPDTYCGIIGNNLMRKAKWQIDYKNKVIRISDKIDNFKIGSKSNIFKTKSGKYGNAQIKIKVNGIEDTYTFDTGFSGNISANISLFNKLNSKKDISYISTNGLTSIGSNGINTSTKYKSLLSIELLDNINLSNQIVSFEENASNLIGNTFFEKFIITLDWENEVFYLDQSSEFKEDILTEYQLFFHPNYEQNQIIIYSSEENYTLDKPIELGTQITEINGIDVSNFNTKELYDYWSNINFTKNVEIQVEEKGTKRKVILTEKQLLPE